MNNKFLVVGIIILIILKCLTSCQSPTTYQIIEKVDVQNLEVIDEFKVKHKGESLFYVVKNGEKYIHNGMISSAIEVYKPHQWANVGDMVLCSDITEFLPKKK